MITLPSVYTYSTVALIMVEHFEGLVLHPYLDKVGKPTIGYGTTQYEDGTPVRMRDAPINPARAVALLHYEMDAKSHALTEALHKYNISLNQSQYDSLISFSYNTGIEGLLGSTLFRLIKKDPKDPGIRAQFMRWNKGHVNGKLTIISALTERRRKEAEVYFSNPIT